MVKVFWDKGARAVFAAGLKTAKWNGPVLIRVAVAVGAGIAAAVLGDDYVTPFLQ